MKHTFLSATLILLIMISFSCRPPQPAAADPSRITASHPFPARERAFGLAFLQRLAATEQNRNLLVSPLSLQLALTMTWNGAAEDTAAAMARALSLEGMPRDKVNQACADLLVYLSKRDPKVRLLIGNSLWLNKGYSFREDFLKRNRTYFAARVASLDFARASAADAINNWIKSQTEGMIPRMIDSIQPDMRLFLVNAVFFQGQWQKKFKKRATRKQPFYLADGTQKNHPLMAREAKVPYYEDDSLQAVWLAYGKGRLGMLVLLPRKDKNLPELLAGMTPAVLDRIRSGLKRRSGSVFLPRFRISYGKRDMKDILRDLGMGKAFTPAADFSGMTKKEKLFISLVLHKALIEVNESGTKASAATVVGMKATGAPRRDRFTFRADRPFLFAITDRASGTILFMGLLHDPEAG